MLIRSCLFKTVGRTDDVFLLETIPDQLQTDRKSFAVHTARHGNSRQTCPADLPEEVSAQMRKYAEQVAEVIGLDTYSRSDFLLDENNHMYCLEANTLPGMTPTSLLPQEAAVIGINFNELCEKLIAISMKKYEG